MLQLKESVERIASALSSQISGDGLTLSQPTKEFLNVTVVSAQNLPSADIGGKRLLLNKYTFYSWMYFIHHVL